MQCCGTISTFHIVEVSLLHLKRKNEIVYFGISNNIFCNIFRKASPLNTPKRQMVNGQAFKIADVQKSTGEFSHVVYLKEFFSKQTLEIRDNPSANFHNF